MGKRMLTDIKVIVFDLDGTLYEDTHHFDYYAKKVEEKLSADKREVFRSDYKAALSGQHPLKIGRVYDAKTDLILTIEDGYVRKAWRWDGAILINDEVQTLYPTKIEVNLDDMLSIGDLWWVPVSIGRHYGLSNKETYEAFLETRDYMMSPHFKMKPIHGLAETLADIRRHITLVVMTNSPEPDSEAILNKLGLAALFHKKIFLAGKPTKSKARFTEIRENYRVHFKEILSVGDNLVNDILPARELGCKTMFIDPHNIGDRHSADVVIKKLSDGIPILRSLQENS
jgi:FMN phosphatase YigB (HAD superfamily)